MDRYAIDPRRYAGFQEFGRALRPHLSLPSLDYVFDIEDLTSPFGGLTVPALPMPAEKAAAPEKPESEAVQVLRSLLATRRKDAQRAVDGIKSRESQIAQHEATIAELKRRNAEAEKRVAASQPSIRGLLADIKKLGGRDEKPAIKAK